MQRSFKPAQVKRSQKEQLKANVRVIVHNITLGFHWMHVQCGRALLLALPSVNTQQLRFLAAA